MLELNTACIGRGDLGVEIPIQQVTNAQKEMVAACNAAGKPVSTEILLVRCVCYFLLNILNFSVSSSDT